MVAKEPRRRVDMGGLGKARPSLRGRVVVAVLRSAFMGHLNNPNVRRGSACRVERTHWCQYAKGLPGILAISAHTAAPNNRGC